MRINDLHRIVLSVKWTYSDPSYSRFRGVVHVFAVIEIEHHVKFNFLRHGPTGIRTQGFCLAKAALYR